jgi:signal transduction histidine kinase
MNGNLVPVILWGFLTVLAMLLTVFFSYIYRKDGDKRKLMFMLAFAFGSLSFLPMMQTGLENIWIMERLHSWSPLPLLSALLIAVVSSLLRIEDFDKLFNAFLFTVATTIFMIVVPLPVKSLHTILYQGISIIVVVVSIYLILTRREFSDLMFLLSMVCYISGGLGMMGGLGVEFVVFAFLFAYVFIALVFITSKESAEIGIASFFALKTELEKTKEKLRISQEKLVKAEKLAAIGKAATMVGHDLRNPLQAIKNATYYLKNELQRLSSSTPIPQKTIEILQIIDNSVDYADKIVKDLHDFSTKKQPILRKTDINVTVEETLSQVEAPENVKLITELSNLPQIEADKDMIKRIFLNLAVNGIQAMKNGGTLKISTKKTNGFVEVSFKDTGTGISKENMEKIFTPFFTTKAEGMGMGLAISKKFVQSHGGNIEVESKEGEGTTFTVKLPIQQNNGGENQ